MLPPEGRSSYCDSLPGKVGEPAPKPELSLWSATSGAPPPGAGPALPLPPLLRALRLLVDPWGLSVVCMTSETPSSNFTRIWAAVVENLEYLEYNLLISMKRELGL